jgi:dual specificity tyrosine-phosphorylation-regulated kinase 1
MLKFIAEKDKEGTSNIVNLLDSFVFRGHQCIVLELLDSSLYDLLRDGEFKGMEMEMI